jgi:hypothetical protein
MTSGPTAAALRHQSNLNDFTYTKMKFIAQTDIIHGKYKINQINFSFVNIEMPSNSRFYLRLKPYCLSMDLHEFEVLEARWWLEWSFQYYFRKDINFPEWNRLTIIDFTWSTTIEQWMSADVVVENSPPNLFKVPVVAPNHWSQSS